MFEQHFAVYRHEDKFLLSPGEAEYLRSLLTGVMQPDPHGLYQVRSLYFDTPDNADYAEKLLGIGERKKLRLRVYSPGDRAVKLEIKNKNGNLSHKETALIRREDALAVIAGNPDALAHYESNTARRFMNLLKTDHRTPAALIEYQREAFLCPAQEVRITFDRTISAAKSSDLFSQSPLLVGLHSAGVTVLEVKYNQFLPGYIRPLLSGCTLHGQSVSKYAAARAMLY